MTANNHVNYQVLWIVVVTVTVNSWWRVDRCDELTVWRIDCDELTVWRGDWVDCVTELTVWRGDCDKLTMWRLDWHSTYLDDWHNIQSGPKKSASKFLSRLHQTLNNFCITFTGHLVINLQTSRQISHALHYVNISLWISKFKPNVSLTNDFTASLQLNWAVKETCKQVSIWWTLWRHEIWRLVVLKDHKVVTCDLWIDAIV